MPYWANIASYRDMSPLCPAAAQARGGRILYNIDIQIKQKSR